MLTCVVSFAGKGSLALYLAGKIPLAYVKGYRSNAPVPTHTHTRPADLSNTQPWLALSALLASTMVALILTANNRHHWQDVTAGSLLSLDIGMFIALVYDMS
jgi:diacylglycerol diphosphate phosphatase/phosphatidate phosphatase